MTFVGILKEKRVYLLMLALALWLGCNPPVSHAMPVNSCERGMARAGDREIIDSFLAQELVSQKLAGMGLSGDEINYRLNRLSGAQIHTLAMHLERIQAGGDGSAMVVVLVALFFLGTLLFFLTHTVNIKPRESQPK